MKCINCDASNTLKDRVANTGRCKSCNRPLALNRAELAWLDAGCYLELESFSTQKLIHILRRAISESRELSTIEDGSMITMDNDGFYTAENFG